VHLLYRLLPVGRFADDLDFRIGGKYFPQKFAGKTGIINNKNFYYSAVDGAIMR